MNLSTPNNRPTAGAPHPMVVMQPGERMICTIGRHPIGILLQYAAAVFGVVMAATIVFLLNPKLTGSGAKSTVLYMGFAVLVFVLVVALGVATEVYWQNKWIVTSDSLTQVSQNGLFGTRVSALSLENLEDVTVDQIGILPHLFNYGTLKAETAGERSKFVFPYCPNPTNYAHEIIDAREKFIQVPPR